MTYIQYSQSHSIPIERYQVRYSSDFRRKRNTSRAPLGPLSTQLIQRTPNLIYDSTGQMLQAN